MASVALATSSDLHHILHVLCREVIIGKEFNRKLCVILFMSEKAVSPSRICCMKNRIEFVFIIPQWGNYRMF